MPKVACYQLDDAVLDKVMHLFWGKGFFATSINELVTVTGLNRAALYKYFGGKEQLYVAMLRRYLNHVTTQLTSPLLKLKENPITALKAFFSQFTHEEHLSVQQNGCFLVMTATDLPLKNEVVDQIISDFLDQLRKLFLNLLSQAVQDELCCSSLPKEQTTSFLIGNTMGVMTLLRAQVPKYLVEEHIAGINQYLENLKRSKDNG